MHSYSKFFKILNIVIKRVNILFLFQYIFAWGQISVPIFLSLFNEFTVYKTEYVPVMFSHDLNTFAVNIIPSQVILKTIKISLVSSWLKIGHCDFQISLNYRIIRNLAFYDPAKLITLIFIINWISWCRIRKNCWRSLTFLYNFKFFYSDTINSKWVI